MNLDNIGLALMTIAILQFTLIPLLADLNNSHASNPNWPGHARFHVVVQVVTTSMIGAAALFFLWSGRVEQELGICIAMILASIIIGGFFIGLFSRNIYGGEVTAPDGLAFAKIGFLDANALNFGIAMCLLISGRLMLL